MSGLEWFNALSSAQARVELKRCCAVDRWADRVADGRPYDGIEALMWAADKAWRSLKEDDWRSGIAHHSRIGERTEGWSREEQSKVATSGQETRDRLARKQRAYEERFGYIFLTCAAGKSGDEMVTELEARLNNGPDTELRLAAEELRRITMLRLEKLIDDEPDHNARP